VAEQLALPHGSAKLRNPWAVFLLILVTLGIYYLVWYYKTNRELADYGVGDSPGISLLAVTLGSFLVIPPFVSMWRYFRRIGEAQTRAGLDHRISHVTGFVLYPDRRLPAAGRGRLRAAPPEPALAPRRRRGEEERARDAR
jgi:hypothetical protein